MDHDTIELIQMILTAGIIPATLFAFKLKSSLDRLNELFEHKMSSDKKAHDEILCKVKDIEKKLQQNEDKNNEEHKEFISLINDLDKRNSVDHAIFSNGRLTQH